MKRILAALAFTTLLASSAMADAIDGDWCAEDGRNLTIHGATIRIPSGAEIGGDYSRHAYRYVGPAGDPEAGQEVRMRLLGEEDMDLQRSVNGTVQPVERWRRCKPIA